MQFYIHNGFQNFSVVLDTVQILNPKHHRGLFQENVRMFYQKWMEEQAQKLVDATARAFTQGRMGSSQGAVPRMPMVFFYEFRIL